MSRIFITGDCHAAYTKLGYKTFPEGRELTKNDYVIVCGDFGLWERSPEMEYWMDWLENRPFSILWVDGNHENYDILAEIPVCSRNGGKAQFIRPSVIHLCRGQLFTIDGKRFFTFGGARSHDICDGILEMDDPHFKETVKRLEEAGALYRINHLTWWKEEMPSDQERQEGIETLEKAGWKTDYIISHCCATSALIQRAAGLFEGDDQTDYFQTIKEKCSFSHWFFGHYHVNEDWSEKETCLYEAIVELTDTGYMHCGISNRFKFKERVRFWTYGKTGVVELTGTIMHIDPRGGGLYAGEQPTANIRTEEGYYHKNIPFEDIFKIT